MNCADFEVLYADYLDGTLDAHRRQAVEQHRSECASCAQFAADVSGALAFLERVADVEPPPELLTKITFEIPRGGPVVRKGWRSYFRPRLHPMLQPRFAMGMAMTLLSFSILGRFAGIEIRQLTPSDLQPAKVWAAVDDRVHRTKERALKYYENMKLVYEVQTRLQEWTEQEEEERKQPRTGSKTGNPPPAREGNVSK